MAGATVNEPEDLVMSAMIKQFRQEKIDEIMKCFQARFMGQEEAPLLGRS